MSSDPHRHPINPISPVVVVIFLVMLGVELIFTLGNQGFIGGPEAVGWRMEAINDFGFSGAAFHWMVENHRWPPTLLMRFVTYMFVSGNFVQMIVAGVMLLALGKFVGEVFAGWAVAALFFGAGIGGVLIWGLLLEDQTFIIGAFPGVYGLIGGFTYILWLRLGESGDNQYRAFAMIGFLMLIQLFFGIIYCARTDWLVDLGGFVSGFLLSFVVSPGGWKRLRAKLRHE
jgi:membrane associated rhomboid family serine protease